MLGVREDVQQTQEGVPMLWQNKRSGRVDAEVIEQEGGGEGNGGEYWSHPESR